MINDQLGEKHFDPFNFTRPGGVGQTVYSMKHNLMAGQFQIVDLSQSQGGKLKIMAYEWLSSVGLISNWKSQEYAWQPLSAASGRRLGPPISLEEPFIAPSQNGQWLAMGGPQMKVWKFPTSSRLPWVLLAAAIPWLLLLWRRKPVEDGQK